MKVSSAICFLCLTLFLVESESFQLRRLQSRVLNQTRLVNPTATATTEHRSSSHQHCPAYHRLSLTQLAKISSNGADDRNTNMAVSLVGSTTSALVSITFFCVLAWKRDAIMVTFFIGSILNGILSKVLKKAIGESRPPELETLEMSVKPSDGGMPSSHAMSLGFIGIFTALCLPWTRPLIAIYILVSLYYRVAVNLHTVEQIVVGLVLGTAHGTMWYQFCQGATVFGVTPKAIVASQLLDEQGILPWPALVVPMIVGAAVVGSFERRITQWLRETKQD
ncbi:hypothetical protein MPSEU_000257900 [Mayamaea pseudoterrestris]|nr:hypothetical protein MPSEU_000257900 [Mayamaea pseudoterrestris]